MKLISARWRAIEGLISNLFDDICGYQRTIRTFLINFSGVFGDEKARLIDFWEINDEIERFNLRI